MTEDIEFVKNLINNDEGLSALELEPLEIISSRRGAIVALVSGRNDSAQYALKTSVESEDNAYNQSNVIEREANILQSLGEVSDDLYVDSHSSDDNTWLLTRWFGTQASTGVAKKLREDGLEQQNNKNSFLKLALMLANKVNVVHQNGYLHGDLQPSHFIINEDKSTLIDWAIAQKMENDPFEYKGAFVHYAAPEIASEMIEKSENIDYDKKAEIYALGAVLFYLYTGKTAVFYGDEDFRKVPFEDKLKHVSEGNLRSFDSSEAPEYPELEEVLMKCLAKDKSERYDDVSAIQKDLFDISSNFSVKKKPSFRP